MQRQEMPHSTAKRYVSLDLLRGLGIWLIVLYHVYKNMFAAEPNASWVYRSLYFTTGYFVFSVGLVLSLHYLPRIADAASRKKTCGRLLIRAAKLLLLLVAANLAMVLVSGNLSAANVMAAFHKVLSLFYKDRWDVTYQVLLSISATLVGGYLLLVSLQKLPRRFQYALLAVAAGSLVVYANATPYFWRFLAYGFVGVVCGYYYRNWSQGHGLWIISLVCAVLCTAFLCITFYAILFDSNEYVIGNLPLGIISSASYTLFFFLFFESLEIEENSNVLVAYVTHVGKNSLFYYLVQGFIVLMLSRYFATVSNIVSLVMSLCVLLLASLLFLAVKRVRHIPSVDTTYRFFFH